MPIYSYKCIDCKCEFDELVQIGQKTVKCIKCGSTKTEKFFVTKGDGVFVPLFKGSGFYETDYKRKLKK